MYWSKSIIYLLVILPVLASIVNAVVLKSAFAEAAISTVEAVSLGP